MTTAVAAPTYSGNNRRSELFTHYHTELQLRNKLVGGIPNDPEIMLAWLRTKANLTEGSKELKAATIATMLDMGIDIDSDASFEDIAKVSKELATRKGNGFKRDANGLFYETRQMKAALREAVNILFAGERRGVTKKGPKSFFVERAFVRTDWVADPIYLLDGETVFQEPSGVELFIGHTDGPRGPQSNLTMYEYVLRPRLVFELFVLKDQVPHEDWPMIWEYASENGIGALRSQGFGCFDVLTFEKV